MSLLELRNIVKTFPGVRALDGVSFELEKGEIHALCGENGAGKSTLIKVLCGVHPQGSFEGAILLNGKTLSLKNLRDSEDQGIALIAQELALVPELSIMENIMLGREPVAMGLIHWDQVRTTAEQALGWVGLDLDPTTQVKDLGVGQQQMVEIAKALAKKATLLVLDEPTAALSESDANRLLSLLKDLRSQGVSCVYISHRLEEVFRLADRITVLRDGRSISTHKVGETSLSKVISEMVGREVKNLYPRPARKEGPVLLKVKDWSVEDPMNPGRYVVRNVTFDVKAGEVLGLAGLMGSGRTALLSSLFGAGRSQVSGSIEMSGSKRQPFSDPQQAISAGLALVSEDRKRYGLVLESSVGENLIMATLRRFSNNGWIDFETALAQGGEQIAQLRIKTPGIATPVQQLSGGNQQKVVVGKWLMTEPKILLLDEPTRGIDVGAKSEMYDLIGLLASRGLAVVLVSSDLPEVLGISHRVMVMNKGLASGPFETQSVTPEKIMSLATG